MEQKKKFKYCVGTIFTVEAATREEADKIAEYKDVGTLELIPLD